MTLTTPIPSSAKVKKSCVYNSTPRMLHGVVFSSLSTETILPFIHLHWRVLVTEVTHLSSTEFVTINDVQKFHRELNSSD
jgi:hypothetical protein